MKKHRLALCESLMLLPKILRLHIFPADPVFLSPSDFGYREPDFSLDHCRLEHSALRALHEEAGAEAKESGEWSLAPS